MIRRKLRRLIGITSRRRTTAAMLLRGIKQTQRNIFPQKRSLQTVSGNTQEGKVSPKSAEATNRRQRRNTPEEKFLRLGQMPRKMEDINKL